MHVRNHASWIVVVAALAALGGVACKSQKAAEDQKKVDELQAQLDDANKQLAAKEQQPAPAETPRAEPPPPPAAAKSEAPKSGAAKPAAGRSGAAKPAAAGDKTPEYLTAEQGQKAKEQYAHDKDKAREEYTQDKEKVKGAFAEQTQTNQQVQTQIEELKSREYTLPVGTVIPVRTTTELTTKLSSGAVFEALLEKALVIDGTVLAPHGAHVTGVVVSSDPGGRVKGVASLAVTIRQIAGARDHPIRVKADNFSAEADTSKGKDAKRTGILAGAGAVVGAIAGGGKGAAIGLGAGAATGVGANMATRGKAAVIPAETLIDFTLTAPTTVIVRQ